MLNMISRLLFEANTTPSDISTSATSFTDALTTTTTAVGNGSQNGAQDNLFVVLMGVGTVFAGLIALIIICKLMGLFFSGKSQKEEDDTRSQTVAIEEEDDIADRQELVAAISAVLAEELGTDVSAIRIHSLKRV